MSALSINPPFPVFPDTDGQPLEDGYIWIGTAGLNPLTNPIVVYWDAALTLPAGQPIRTINGFPSRAGTPARLYAGSDYSIQVQNKNGSLVYSSANATELLSSELVTFIQAGAGAVQRTAQSKMRDIVSVKDFGAVGDGVTDDTAAIQAAIDASNDIEIKDGSFSVNQLNVSSKTRFTIRLVNAVLVERTAKTDGLINITSSSQVSIISQDSSVLGSETIAAYLAGEGYPAVKASDSNKITIYGLKVTNKTQAVFMGKCINSRVEGCQHIGIFSTQPTLSPVGTTSFKFSGGSHNIVANNTMSNSGEGIASGESGGDPVYYKIYGNHIDTLYDNGIYLSSGNYFSVWGNTVLNCTHTINSPSGMKIRGSGHSVFGNTVRSCKVGISATGNGATSDGFVDLAGNAYYNGNGTRIFGNYVYGCERYGISLQNQDVDSLGNNLYPREFVVSENTIENCGNGGFSPVLIFGGYGHKIINNSIRGSLRTIDGTSTEITIAINLSRGTTAPNTTNLQAIVVSGNNTSTAATSSNLTVNGVVRGDFSNNTIVSSGSANSLKIDNTTNSVFQANLLAGNGSETSINEAATCSNNYFSLNQGRVATYQQTASIAMNNFMTAGSMIGTATAIGATPKQIGIIAISGGNAYISTATASSADWKIVS